MGRVLPHLACLLRRILHPLCDINRVARSIFGGVIAMDDTARLLLEQMDLTLEGEDWFPAMRRTLDGLTAAQAAWRPSPAANSIWQLVNHMAYWKEVVARRLAGDVAAGTEDNDATFGPPGDPADEAGWEAARQRLYAADQAVRSALAGRKDLDSPLPGYSTPLRTVIADINLHDAYHLGQIVLLRKLQGCW